MSVTKAMGIFNSIFGKKISEEEKENKALSWMPLTAMDQLNSIEKLSADKPQIIFKHSTSCGISTMVLRLFEENYSLGPEKADLYYLDLHGYREISNEVANKFNVYHQSPQLLVIINGVAVAHNSHGAIAEMDLDKYVQKRGRS